MHVLLLNINDKLFQCIYSFLKIKINYKLYLLEHCFGLALISIPDNIVRVGANAAKTGR